MMDFKIVTSGGVGINTFTKVISKKINAIYEESLEPIAYIIRDDIIDGRIYARKTPSGNAQRPLSPTTIKQKGHAHQLIHTGQLLRSILVQKITNGYEVYAGGNRSEIAAYLHYGSRRTMPSGNTVYVPPLPFFDVSKDAEKKIDNFLELAMQKKLEAFNLVA